MESPSCRRPVATSEGLFARALGSQADIILMDDPMRGVDVGTKREVYGLIREEAARGRTFLWYTTETDELEHCDHVRVPQKAPSWRPVARRADGEKVLHASFRDDA
jgi:ribose transport system ATP-binding protein